MTKNSFERGQAVTFRYISWDKQSVYELSINPTDNLKQHQKKWRTGTAVSGENGVIFLEDRAPNYYYPGKSALKKRRFQY